MDIMLTKGIRSLLCFSQSFRSLRGKREISVSHLLCVIYRETTLRASRYNVLLPSQFGSHLFISLPNCSG